MHKETVTSVTRCAFRVLLVFEEHRADRFPGSVRWRQDQAVGEQEGVDAASSGSVAKGYAVKGLVGVCVSLISFQLKAVHEQLAVLSQAPVSKPKKKKEKKDKDKKKEKDKVNKGKPEEEKKPKAAAQQAKPANQKKAPTRKANSTVTATRYEHLPRNDECRLSSTVVLSAFSI